MIVGRFGVDVSGWQKKTIDWSAVFGRMDWAYLKVSQDEGYTSKQFRSQAEGALAVAGDRPDKLVGAYHFAVPEVGDDPAFEAERLVDGWGRYLFTLRPVLDFEEAHQGKRLPGNKPDPKFLMPAQDLVDWADAFVDRVEELLGFPPILYTYAYFLVARRKAFLASRLSRCPLIMAKYSSRQPKDVRPWKAWDGWQYTNRAKVPGIPGRVDANVATPAGFDAFRVPKSSELKRG